MARFYAFFFLILLPLALFAVKDHTDPKIWDTYIFPNLVWLGVACQLWILYRKERHYGLGKVKNYPPIESILVREFLISFRRYPLYWLFSFAPGATMYAVNHGGYSPLTRLIVQGISILVLVIHAFVSLASIDRFISPKSNEKDDQFKDI